MDAFDELKEFNLSEDVVKKLRDPDYLRKELAEGKSFREIFNYSDETMATFYNAAHTLFQKQAYQEAADAFFFLTNLNPYSPTYWLGLGMSEHLNAEHASALVAYGMCALVDPKNPLPHYHSAGCYHHLHDIDSALKSYDLAIEVAGHEQEHAILKEHAQKGKENLLKK